MTPEIAWWVRSRLNPLRVVYPQFDPTRRPAEPWEPIQENREFWKRTQPRKAEFICRQQGWPSEPLPVNRPERPSPIDLRGVPMRHRTPEEQRYHNRLVNALPTDGRWSRERGYLI